MANRMRESFSGDTGNEAANGRSNTLQVEYAATQSIELEETDVLPCSLSADEEAFFEAVRRGDKAAVEELINVKGVDVDCKNFNGETALEIAVQKESFEMLQTLLRNKADIGSALYQAVRNNSLQCVRTLVAYDSSHRKNSAAKTLERGAETTSRRGGSGKFDEFLTPLVLAVLNENYEIVEFLVSKGYKVEDPHMQKAQDEKESMVRLRDSLVKLNTYRALASPLYISHTFLHEMRERKDLGKKSTGHIASDPLFRSFVLKRKLKELAGSENEFRDDYHALSAQAENFAVGLLNECRNLEEIAAVMDMPEIEKVKKEVRVKQKERRLRVLNLAIKYRNRKFIAHPYSQVMLNSVVYKGSGRWHHLSFATKFLLVLLYALAMPLCMLGYIFTPANRLTKKMETPLCKLMSQASSVLWFLALVSMSAFQDEYDSFLHLSPLSVIIGIWVVGITVQEAKQALYQGMERYLGEWWHLAVIPMILFYILAAVLYIVGYASIASDSGEWAVHVRHLVGKTSLGPYQLLLLSNSFYSLALVLTFFEASHLLQVNSTLGPLHLSLMMMVKDIVRFLALFAFNVCAFALAMRKLYSQYVQTSTHVATNNNSTTNHTFERIDGTLSTLFWALFGHVEFSTFETDKNSQITKVTGELLFAGYSLASVLVLLNLLIAMLNNSYKKVDKEKDIKFKFARTRIWMYYVSEVSPLPPPFNLIPVEKVVSGLRWLATRYRWIKKCLGCIKTEEISSVHVKSNEKRRRVVIKNLIHRYYSGKEKQQKEEPSDDTPAPDEDTPQPDEVQTKLMEVTKTLQGLQNAVKQFRHKVPKKHKPRETEVQD